MLSQLASKVGYLASLEPLAVGVDLKSQEGNAFSRRAGMGSGCVSLALVERPCIFRAAPSGARHV